MNVVADKKNKHLILNQVKIDLAKEILGAKTETETIELALDSIITEEERNKKAFEIHEEFLASDARIEDVFGNLEND
jgi:hypothetical protein